MKGKEVEEVVEGGGVGGGFKLTDEQEKVVEEVLAKEYGEEEPCSEAERGEKPEESKVNICVPLGDGYLPTDEEVERISDIDKQLDRFFKVREQGRGTLAGGEEEVLFSCRSSVSAEMDGSHSRYAPITTARSNREDAQHFEKIMRKTNITVGGKVDFLRQIRLEKEERERLEKIDSSLRQTAMSEGTEKEGSEKIDHAIIAALMMQYRIEVDAEEKLAAEEQSMAERWEEHKLSETRRMEEEKQRQEEQKLSRTKKRDEIARKMKAQKKKETTKS
uniref:Uncharacterized protein n=1 Tax=Palpitomonas bilix TaxID=652834 RepID=A0A7S3D312_9EUKA|mmetsp:Transcript_20025/g.51102  ORF Transcript_20025/g.51102 Transcript_20025/m.51102 type:complete len:276 (+) Transcript_20025:3-830(+)